MFAALAAELAELQTAGGRLLVLGGGVVLVLAISTLQLNDFAGHGLNSFLDCSAFVEPCPGPSPDIRDAVSDIPELIRTTQ
jgi:hypothetical protein